MKVSIIGSILVVLACALRGADTLEHIEAEMKKSWDKLTSISMETESKTEHSTESASMKGSTTTVAEMMKEGNQWKMRSESTSTKTSKGGDLPDSIITTQSLTIMDGEYSYTVLESIGKKSATKHKGSPDLNKRIGGGFIETNRENHTLKVLPDEIIEGVQCWAIEATPKANARGTMKYLIDKTNGMVMLTEKRDATGKVQVTSKTKNIKLNPVLSPERFVFTPPADMKVYDLSRTK